MTFEELVKNILVDIINNIIPVIMVLTLIVFFWGLAKFILRSGDEKEIESGKKLMFWGIIVFFVFVGVWGLVGLITGSFGIEAVIPQFGKN